MRVGLEEAEAEELALWQCVAEVQPVAEDEADAEGEAVSVLLAHPENDALEEAEETAKLFFLTRGLALPPLTDENLDELKQFFDVKW